MTRLATKAAKNLQFDDRLARALAAQPATFKIKHAQLIVEARGGNLEKLVILAAKLLCDARWLAIGEPSRAAEQAVRRVRLWSGFSDLPEPQQRSLMLCLELTAEGAIEPEACRYCGCTDGLSCPDKSTATGTCRWVDGQHTVCSACLEGAS